MAIEPGKLVAVDDGYLDTKTAAQSGCIVIPSRARHLAVGEQAVGGLGSASVYLLDSAPVDGRSDHLMVDPTIDGEDTCFEGYHTSDLNRAIVHHALRKAGFGGTDVVLAAGLPVGEYFDKNGAVNRDLIEAKRANLMRPVRCEDGAPAANVRRVHVMAQSICAWINHAMDAKGHVKSGMRPVGVVDVGGRTLDSVVVLPPNRIDPSRSGTRELGVADVRKLVGAEIGRLCGIDHVPSQLVQIAVARGIYLHEGERIDVRKIVADAEQEVADKMVAAIQDVMGPVKDLEYVLFVGGGFGAMPWISRSFENAVSADSPAYANARGMYKYMRHVEYR